MRKFESTVTQQIFKLWLYPDSSVFKLSRPDGTTDNFREEKKNN